MAEKTVYTNLDAKVTKSVELANNLLSGRETGHRIEIACDHWEGVGPGNRIKMSPRSYKVITPDGKEIQETWTVVKQSDGVTIKPVLEADHDQYLVYIFKPHPAIGLWLLEFPSGGKKPTETIEQTALREVEEETGFKPNRVEVIMRNMRFAPFRFEQDETVVDARNLVQGSRKLEYEETPIEVHVIPVKLAEELLRRNVIADFRTYAVTADHLLRS